MIETLTARLGVRLNVSEESHYMGALGAAIFALEHILESRGPRKPTEAKV